MDRPDRLGLGQAQEIAVAAHVARVVAEPLAAELGLGEPVGLEHRAHRAVEDQDPLAQDPGQGREAGGAIERRGPIRASVGGRNDRGGGHAFPAPTEAAWPKAPAAVGSDGWRARIRRTSSAHCSYRPKLGMM